MLSVEKETYRLRTTKQVINRRKSRTGSSITVRFRSFYHGIPCRGMSLVAVHWEYRFNHMVHRYNEIFREQMPNITPHVCRHTYCSIQAKAGMYPKTLQYLKRGQESFLPQRCFTLLPVNRESCLILNGSGSISRIC